MIYVVELTKPIIKLRTFLSDKKTTYIIPAIQETKVSQFNLKMIVKTIHAIITSEKKE